MQGRFVLFNSESERKIRRRIPTNAREMEKTRHSPRVDVHHGQLLLGSVAGNKITSVRSLQMAMGATSSYIPAVKKLQCVLLDLAWKSIEDCILSRTGLVDIVQALRLLSQRQRATGGVFDADLTLQRAVWYVVSVHCLLWNPNTG